MAELSGESIDAARQREDALVARNKTAASTDVELENVLHSAHQTQAQLGQRLDRIERALDEGVSRAGSLKTPAAKRAFQQFLLAKHQEIVQVLEDGKQSAADLASQMTGVGGQYPPASSAGGQPGGSDAAVRAASFEPPLKTGGAAPGTSEDDGDGIGMSSLFVDTTQHGNGHDVPPSPTTAPPPAAGAPSPPAASGGSQGIGMSSLFADTTPHDPAPPAPITTAEDSQRASGGDLNGSMGMGPGAVDTTQPQPPAGAGPIYKDPRELGPPGMVEQIPHSGVWVRPDQVDHDVFTISPDTLAPANSVYVGKAPNGDEIWRYADPGPR